MYIDLPIYEYMNARTWSSRRKEITWPYLLFFLDHILARNLLPTRSTLCLLLGTQPPRAQNLPNPSVPSWPAATLFETTHLQARRQALTTRLADVVSLSMMALYHPNFAFRLQACPLAAVFLKIGSKTHMLTPSLDDPERLTLALNGSTLPSQLLDDWDASIGEATHETLIEHQNLAYMDLMEQYQSKKQHLDRKIRAYSELEIRYDELKAAFSELTAAVGNKLSNAASGSPSGLAPVQPFEILHREDYPDVPIWTDKEYLTAHGDRKAAKGPVTMEDTKARCGSKRLSEDDENVTFWFVTNIDGTEVTGSWGREARQHARAIWVQLHTEGVAPFHWSEASMTVREFYAYHMELKFPELRLCEFSSKAHRIATLGYSGWKKKYFEEHGYPSGAIKTEDVDKTEMASTGKREASERPAGEPLPKKTKAEKNQESKNHKRPQEPVTAPTPDAQDNILTQPTIDDTPTPVVPPIADLSTTPQILPEPTLSAPAARHEQPATAPAADYERPSPPPHASEPQTDLMIIDSPPPPASPIENPLIMLAAQASRVTQIDNPLDAPVVQASRVENALGAQVAQASKGSQIENPLAALLGEATGPTTRAEFVEVKPSKKTIQKNAVASSSGTKQKVTYLRATNSTTPRNLCLKDYIIQNGPVTKEVFETKSANAAKAAHDAANSDAVLV
ncbi:hypothetical protein C8R43DRAFT_1133788 [Mycena crocata]|nr:hypothetical protein C8R43DRAFT_1133788 [Mycena crocata]